MPLKRVKVDPQTGIEKRTLPCCGIEIDWKSEWFDYMRKLVPDISEEGILESLASRHACDLDKDKKDENR